LRSPQAAKLPVPCQSFHENQQLFENVQKPRKRGSFESENVKEPEPEALGF
jgi:hypothetical protein